MTSVATPASAEAVTKAGQCGKIAVVGLATPNAMKPYVNADCVKSVVLWNPVDLGYAATYVMRAVADGKLKPGATSVDAGKLGKLNVVNGSEILLGSPFIFNKDNVDQVRLLRKAHRSTRSSLRAERSNPGIVGRFAPPGSSRRLARPGRPLSAPAAYAMMMPCDRARAKRSESRVDEP